MKHALVIEDNTLIALMIQTALWDAGFQSVEVVGSQEAAIATASVRCPDLITVDEELDGGSGIATIKHICRDQSIPVLFIVADDNEIRRAIPNAIILSKPFSQHALAKAIASAQAQDFIPLSSCLAATDHHVG